MRKASAATELASRTSVRSGCACPPEYAGRLRARTFTTLGLRVFFLTIPGARWSCSSAHCQARRFPPRESFFATAKPNYFVLPSPPCVDSLRLDGRRFSWDEVFLDRDRIEQHFITWPRGDEFAVGFSTVERTTIAIHVDDLGHARPAFRSVRR
jgi:hypothetical protein